MNRREFLRLSSLVASASALAACQPAYRALGGPVETLTANPAFPISPSDYSALSRLTFGPRQSEIQRVAEIRLAGWIEEQLSPSSIDDAPLDWRLRGFDILHQTADDIYTNGSQIFGGFNPEPALSDMKAITLLRQVYSRRQLYEVMAAFWTDHFNISMDKEDVWYLKPGDDRDVIRPNVLGRFHDLLSASAHSPAMLTYLDNQVNEARAPNENYARELMELHTLGVDGGYTQADVMELARCFTGWTVKTSFWRGDFEFNPDFHDQAAKTVLGLRIEPGGQLEAERLLEILADHPATARHLATKLIRRFIADDPPADLVDRAADAFLKTGGDIPAMLRVILLDGLLSLGDALPMKFKRPVDFVAASLRTLNAETDGGAGKDKTLHETLARLGQSPFQWPTPDGPPDTAPSWMGSLLPRWRFAAQLARNEIRGTVVDVDALLQLTGADGIESFIGSVTPLMLGTPLDQDSARRLADALRAEGAADFPETAQIIVAGILSSPAFQWK